MGHIILGLDIEIFLDQPKYMSGELSQQAGARVVVHNAATSPLVDELGLNVQPGTASSIAVQMVRRGPMRVPTSTQPISLA